MRDMRVEFLAKLYFFHTLELRDVDALLEAQKDVCRRRLDQLAHRAEGRAEDRFERIVDVFRRLRIEASLAWLDTVEREFV
jgi:hypothetical protein